MEIVEVPMTEAEDAMFVESGTAVTVLVFILEAYHQTKFF